jgi:5,5'-dehydrodivanillate O-demethylase oxygenase subunit
MANEEQGPILDRTQEHLTPHDTVLVRMRRLYLAAITDVAQGRDPKHIIRDPEANRMVLIRGEEDAELV